jgi:hypothetical protein
LGGASAGQSLANSNHSGISDGVGMAAGPALGGAGASLALS